MRVALIGSGGQIATALRLRLAAEPGIALKVLARPDIDLAVPVGITPAIRAFAPDIILNPAAYTAVDKAESEPDQAFAINRDGARAIAEASHAAGAALVHLSTDYVFDGAKPTPYVETDPTAPLGVYGASKLAGEEAVRAACPRHVILRTSWVCSPHGNNFVKTMMRLANERPELRVVADQRGCPSFAGDIADAIAAMLPRIASAKASDDACGTFHITNSGETTWAGLAEAVMAGAQARGHAHVPVIPITTADYPTPARRPANSRLDGSKLAHIHGLDLPPWQKGLARCLDALLGPVHKA
ncbi:MAG: dTDP-4-dehydrorhamnose reductase [Bosea sp. (in: a-proteobacteria)]